jgi:hypothetical protein
MLCVGLKHIPIIKTMLTLLERSPFDDTFWKNRVALVSAVQSLNDLPYRIGTFPLNALGQLLFAAVLLQALAESDVPRAVLFDF